MKDSPFPTNMPFNVHAFAGNPLRTKYANRSTPISPISAVQTLKSLISGNSHQGISLEFKVLPFRKGRPMAFSSFHSSCDSGSTPCWHLGWVNFDGCKSIFAESGKELLEDSLIFLGSSLDGGIAYWAADVTGGAGGSGLQLGGRGFCFVELRTLMVASKWDDSPTMGDLAIAGHAKALIEWHNTSCFCGHCGAIAVTIDAGRRKQCTNEVCKKRIYPRLDPVVIMLLIDKANDRALLSRPSKFIPHMWTCLSGFVEPGESFEEAVRRETFEETGIEVGEVIYHSSQPWPVGATNMPCQLMVGFFAYAKSLEIHLDKKELEDAQWYSREVVQDVLTFAEYEKAQKTAAVKVDQMCKGVEKKQRSFFSDFNLESSAPTTMFVPGPFAIAHHLISTWVHQTIPDGTKPLHKQSASYSSL